MQPAGEGRSMTSSGRGEAHGVPIDMSVHVLQISSSPCLSFPVSSLWKKTVLSVTEHCTADAQ